MAKRLKLALLAACALGFGIFIAKSSLYAYRLEDSIIRVNRITNDVQWFDRASGLWMSYARSARLREEKADAERDAALERARAVPRLDSFDPDRYLRRDSTR